MLDEGWGRINRAGRGIKILRKGWEGDDKSEARNGVGWSAVPHEEFCSGGTAGREAGNRTNMRLFLS